MDIQLVNSSHYFVYWTDVKEKSISRAMLSKQTSMMPTPTVETLVDTGLDFPDGLAVDRVTGNVYWTDMGLHRIQVRKLKIRLC